MILRVVLVISLSCAVSCRSTPTDVSEVNGFALVENGYRVEGETLRLPMNQGRGFLCPMPTAPRPSFWGFRRGLLDDVEVHIDREWDADRVVGPGWKEGGGIDFSCLRLGKLDPRTQRIEVDACGPVVHVPWPKHVPLSNTIWGVCSYPNGGKMLGFIAGVSQKRDELFHDVFGGWVAIRADAAGEPAK